MTYDHPSAIPVRRAVERCIAAGSPVITEVRPEPDTSPDGAPVHYLMTTVGDEVAVYRLSSTIRDLCWTLTSPGIGRTVPPGYRRGLPRVEPVTPNPTAWRVVRPGYVGRSADSRFYALGDVVRTPRAWIVGSAS